MYCNVWIKKMPNEGDPPYTLLEKKEEKKLMIRVCWANF